MNVRAARLTTKALVGVCGALLLLVIVQYAGLGRGYHWTADGESDAVHAPLGTIDSQPLKLPPASAFADIDAHPLFNEDRKPTPLDAADGTDTPPPSLLNIALTGVILDEKNHVRIAMLQDKTRNQAIALKVGMPLEGDQASWTLIEVKPRGVVFKSATNETTEVELETAAAPAPVSGKAPTLSPRPGQPLYPIAPPGVNARPNVGTSPKNADASADLAHRIEERRKQMREDAERLRDGGKPAQPQH
jgi:general secretion pathway protein N